LKEGNYDILQGKNLLKKISFNISDEESQLGFKDEKGLADLIDANNLDNASILSPKADQISRKIQQEQDGIPLWKYFILGAILFLILEVLVIKLRINS